MIELMEFARNGDLHMHRGRKGGTLCFVYAVR
jgi:hypothetical protein